jgi:hypothetical protein
MLSKQVLVEPTKVDPSLLVEEGSRFIETLSKNNSRFLLHKVAPTSIYLTDHGSSYELSLRGLRPAEGAPDSHDIALSSGALLYCLRFPWGGETLTINGRFRAPQGGDRHRFFHWFSIAHANSQGLYYNLGYYARKAATKFFASVPVLSTRRSESQ